MKLPSGVSFANGNVTDSVRAKMPKTIKAEYLAGEQKLKLDEPLDGVADHARFQVSLHAVQAPDSKPWLSLKGGLPKEAITAWRASLEALSAPDEQE
jgi:hypothetical protein